MSGPAPLQALYLRLLRPVQPATAAYVFVVRPVFVNVILDDWSYAQEWAALKLPTPWQEPEEPMP